MFIEYHCPYCFCLLSKNNQKAENHVKEKHKDLDITKKPVSILIADNGSCKCPECNSIVSQKQLMGHYEKLHKKHNKPASIKTNSTAKTYTKYNLSPEDQLYCPYCIKSIQKKVYFHHIHNAHNKKALERKPIKVNDFTTSVTCPYCAKKFKNIHDLQLHYKENHEIKEEVRIYPATTTSTPQASIIDQQISGSLKYTEKIKKSTVNDKTPLTKNNNPLFIIEMLKINLKSSSEKYYSKKQLVEMLKTKNHIDPMGLITKNLLIETCKDLYKDDGLMWYLTGDNNNLQICRADSLLEWQKMQAFSEIFIPNISINGKLVSFNEFTLYVYDSISNLKCPSSPYHKVENVTIITKNMFGKEVKFNAFHCINCNRYYTNKEAVKSQFILNDYPLFKINYPQIGTAFRSESELTLYGYNAQKDGMPEYGRQNLISKLLFYKVLTKETVIKILKNNINIHSKIENHAEAVKKWEADLDFVMNYGIDSQDKVLAYKTNVVYKGKKQK